MTKKRIATLATCLTLVGAVAVGGTLALLTSGPKNITNTFAVSDGYDDKNMDFIVEEQAPTPDALGNYIVSGPYVTTNQEYLNLVEGSYLEKNPRFTLRNAADDETTPPDSWVVAKLDATQIEALITNGIKFDDVNDEDGMSTSTGWKIVTAERENADAEWTYTLGADLTATALNALEPDSDTKRTYFIYTKVLSADDSGSTESLFTQLEVKDLNTKMDRIDLTVSGVAVQALTNNLEGEGVLSQVMADAVAAFNAQ